MAGSCRPEPVPIISESMSGSRKWRFTLYAGTSKTLDGTLERVYNRSSRGEWDIKCPSCGKENLASASEDLLNMIGPKGLICGKRKCSHALDTRQGFWLHEFPDRLDNNSGWHIPQPILPMHCEDARAWKDLLRKQKEYRESVFLNECLGEACDIGTKLITLTQIKKASVLPIRNNLNQAIRYHQKKRRYVDMAIGIDWGERRGRRPLSSSAAASRARSLSCQKSQKTNS